MAEKKKTSQAQKAASAKQQSKASAGKKTTAGKGGSQEAANAPMLPVRAILAIVCAILFIFFLVMFLNPEGALTVALMKFVQGLIGKVSFYIAIPALLYLFAIQAFSGKRPVILRSVCLIVFVLLCGCISQLAMDSTQLPTGFAMLATLYQGGAEGTTAGLLCGGFALILKALCGTVISAIALTIGAVMTLLASFQITIPSIVRAIQNRPRAEWEDEENERQEPAAVVVNHITHKRLQHIEEKRQRRAQLEQEMEEASQEPSAVPEKPVRKKDPKQVDDMMRQIHAEVDEPVAAADRDAQQSAPSNPNPPEPPKTSQPGGNVPPTVPPAEVVPAQMPPLDTDAPIPPAPVSPETPDKITARDAEESAAQVAAEIAEAATVQRPEYCFPPIDLLHEPVRSQLDGTNEMRENTRRLNETLASFKIDAHIVNVTRGPSVTRYEVELDRGVRLSKLTGCAEDIALSLGASGVRIAAVPGKISVVGIEVPNRAVTTVSLREVIHSNEFSRAKSKSSFAVGKDIGGACIVGNIAKLPHMLIAGTTGSGKSVCMNSIIISLLYKASPDDVKLIMIDPKMVELGIYNGIPHLLIPVVTDPKKAAGSLQWAVTEMMRRYRAMSDLGVRDLESYNSIVEAEEEGAKLPQVVVIIDELADLMLVAAKEVEESICRIAQMGRAAGIHLIIATQRPSADVITGLMKANIPSRIAFAVASAMESRIILDTQGAEKLVGRGDMLFAPIGSGKPLRVQGCFVSDEEVESVASYVKDHYTNTYDQTVIEEIERKAAQTGNSKATVSDPEPNVEEADGDELLPAAVDVFLETGQASVSMLQRRLKLGYARAARIVDEMEEKGIVGPFQGSKPRTILVTREQWEAMRTDSPAQMAFEDLDSDGASEDDD